MLRLSSRSSVSVGLRRARPVTALTTAGVGTKLDSAAAASAAVRLNVYLLQHTLG